MSTNDGQMAIPTRNGSIDEFESVIAGVTPFLLFWRAQNAIHAMYGVGPLGFKEVKDIWRRTYEKK